MSGIRLEGIKRTQHELNLRRDSFLPKAREFMAKMAKSGFDISQIRFRQAQYDGTNDVVVNEPKWIDDNTIEVLAIGNAVTFIEFGTGIHYKKEHPLASEMGAVRGGYGKHRGSRDTWSYYGEPGTDGVVAKTNAKGTLILTHGNPPARAMYFADKAMKDMVLEAAREAFK